MNDLAKDVFDLGMRLNQAQAEMLRAPQTVYLLWKGETLMGICGTKTRAEQEAEDLGHGLGEVIRIEARVVHS